MKMTIIFNNGNTLDDCMSGLISEFGFYATEETGIFSNGDGLTIYGTDRSLHLDGEDDAVTALFNDEILPAYNTEIRKTFVNESTRPVSLRLSFCMHSTKIRSGKGFPWASFPPSTTFMPMG